MKDLSDQADPIGEVADEILLRHRQGERPSLTEYCSKYPELAHRIRELFPTLIVMEELRPDEDSLDRLSDRLGRHTQSSGPHRVGDYRLVREIGRGGMGVVFEAEQESLGRRVALKILPKYAAVDQKSLARFHREARAAARLHHSNIVPVLGVGEQDGLHYYVMQHIEGSGLDEALDQLRRSRLLKASSSAKVAEQRDPLTESPHFSPLSDGGRKHWQAVAKIGIQAAEALAYANGQGVLHRDIKPSNLLLDAQGAVWITDFGLAKAVDSVDLTQTDDVVGTLRYMAPERLKGHADARSDVYGLGVTLYEMLTLRPAFDECDRHRLLGQISQHEPTHPRACDARIPVDLETIVLTAIAKDPDRRYPDAAALAEDLRRFLADRPVLARRASSFERTWRSCRRNPTVASLSFSLILVFLVGFGGVVWKWREAEGARQDERVARKEATDRADELRQAIDQLRSANTLLERGRVYVEWQRWDDADKAFTKAIRLRPDHVPAHEERGYMYARLGLWDLAAADLDRAFKLQEPAIASRWWCHALSRFYMGDIEEYVRTCDRMYDGFAGSNVLIFTVELVRASALTPDQRLRDPKQLVELAQSAVEANPSDPYFLYVLGLAHYRAEQYEQAAARFKESLGSRAIWSSSPLNFSVLAMAHHHLGQHDQARRALEKATAAIDQWTQQIYSSGKEMWVIHHGATGVWPIACWDWLEAQLYYREARSVLGLPAPNPDPRLHVLRARAFAGMRRPADADAEYIKASAQAPHDVSIRWEAHRNRGFQYVIHRRYDLAAQEYSRASSLHPDDSDLWRFLAVTHLAAGDFPSYRKVCAAMLDRFEHTTISNVAHDVVEACVLRPDAVDDSKRLLPIAQTAALWYPGANRMLGAANYRAARYDEAVRCIQASANVHRLRPIDSIFLAMAHHRLNQRAEAQHYLDQTMRWIEQADARHDEDLAGTQPAWGNWQEPLEVKQLLQELEGLMLAAPLVQSTRTGS